MPVEHGGGGGGGDFFAAVFMEDRGNRGRTI